MRSFFIRTAIRLTFYTLALYVALRLNASHFDETEVTSLFEFLCAGAAFETAMAFLPASLAGKLRFTRYGAGDISIESALKVAGGLATVLFCAVFVAVAIDVRKEIGGLREAFLSGDVQTSWPEGAELRTVRTPHDGDWTNEQWIEAHINAVRTARRTSR